MALIKPVVYSQLLREKFDGKVRVARLARELSDIDGFRQVGEKIVFPKFKTITAAEKLTKGNSFTPVELDQDSSEATIVMLGKSVDVYDIEDMTALGEQVDEAAEQISTVVARGFDDDLIAEAKTSVLKSATAGASAITGAEVNAGFQLFGDEQDYNTFAGIVINSLLVPSFLAMPEFVDATKTYAMLGNGVMVDGMIGSFRQVPVYVSDKGTYDSVASECVSLIIKKGALGYKTKRVFKSEEQRDINKQMTTINGNLVYAVKLLADDGVVVVRKTIA
jgi:hypothetical protein